MALKHGGFRSQSVALGNEASCLGRSVWWNTAVLFVVTKADSGKGRHQVPQYFEDMPQMT